MTTRTEAVQAILTRWAECWGTLTPYQFENEAFPDKPSDGVWARLTIRHTASEQSTLGRTGRRDVKRMGVVVVQLYESRENGRGGLDNLVQEVESALELVTLTPNRVYLLEASSPEEGQEDKWFTMTSRIPFWYIETK